MKKLFYFLGAGILLSLALGSCKKKEGDNQHLDDDNITIEDFMSTNPNSFWEYQSNEGEHFIRKPLGTTAIMNEREWDYYESTEQNTGWITKEYFAQNGEYYVMLLDLDGSQTEYVEMIVHKEDANIGDLFTNSGTVSYSGFNIHIFIEGEVIETDLTYDLNGETIEGVTVIKNNFKAKTGILPYVDCGDGELYFKEGLGILKMDIDLDIMSFYTRTYKDELIDYFIAEDE